VIVADSVDIAAVCRLCGCSNEGDLAGYKGKVALGPCLMILGYLDDKETLVPFIGVYSSLGGWGSGQGAY
jgi:hypothetical protein